VNVVIAKKAAARRRIDGVFIFDESDGLVGRMGDGKDQTEV